MALCWCRCELRRLYSLKIVVIVNSAHVFPREPSAIVRDYRGRGWGFAFSMCGVGVRVVIAILHGAVDDRLLMWFVYCIIRLWNYETCWDCYECHACSSSEVVGGL